MQRRAHQTYPTFSPRHRVLGSGYYRNIQPAWRDQARTNLFGLSSQPAISPDQELKHVPPIELPGIKGSQILVTNLPRDVDQKEVEVGCRHMNIAVVGICFR